MCTPHFFLLKFFFDSKQFILFDNVSTINNPVADPRGRGGGGYTYVYMYDYVYGYILMQTQRYSYGTAEMAYTYVYVHNNIYMGRAKYEYDGLNLDFYCMT